MEKGTFLALWFFPPFLFSALIHIGDPDQALTSIPALAVLGGGVLAAILPGAGWGRILVVSAQIIAIHVFCFLNPPIRLAQATSYRMVANIDRMTTDAISSISALRTQGPVTILHYGSPVTSRQISYYFPSDRVIVLRGSPLHRHSPESPEIYFRHQPLPAQAGDANGIQVATTRLLFLAPMEAKPSDFPGWQHRGSVYYLDLVPQTRIALGSYHLNSAVTSAVSHSSSD